MTIKTMKVGYLQTNCYIVTSQSQKEAAIIDPGGGYERIKAYLEKNNKMAGAILLTHGHFDHIMAAKKFQDMGVKVHIHTLDKDYLQNSGFTRNLGVNIPPFSADKLFEDEQVIEVGDLKFKIMHTPGHSRGSSCFIIEDTIFSGDTLFYQDYGRTDLAYGSQSEMEKSLTRLLSLEGEYRILPGHMDETTLEHEKKFNPFVR